MYKTIIGITLFLLCFFQIQAQQWVNCTNGDYINDMIVVDNSLWVASQGGIMKYTPESEEKVFFNRGNSDIPSNQITSIIADDENKIWVSNGMMYGQTLGTSFFDGENWTRFDTIGGVLGKAPNGDIVIASSYAIYRYDGNSFTTIPIPIEHPNYCPNPIAMDINRENGDIWISSYDYGCYSLLHYDGNVFEVFNHENSPLSFDSPYTSKSLFVDSSGKLWMGSWSGVLSFDGENWVKYDSDNSNIPDGIVTSIQEDEDGSIWVGISNYYYDDNINFKSLASFDGENWTAYELPIDNFQSQRVRSFLITDFYLVLGTENGLFSYDLNDLRRIQSSNSGLTSNSITSILQQDEYTWVADGLGGIEQNNQLIRIKGDEWVTFDSSNAIFEANNSYFQLMDTNPAGDVFVRKGSKIYSFDGNSWSEFIVPDLVDEAEETNSILKFDSNGAPWLFNDHGYIFRKMGAQWQVISPQEHGNISGYFNGIAFDPSNNELWFGTYNGIFHYDGITWTHYPETGLYSNYIRDLQLDENGQVWMAGVDGFCQFDGTTFTTHLNEEIGVEANFLSLKIDHQGHIWGGAMNTLVEYDGENWTLYDTHNSGLPNRQITSISEDKYHNIWIGTDGAGFSLFNKDSIQNGVIHTATNEVNAPLKLNLYPNLLADNKIITLQIPGKMGERSALISIYNNRGEKIFRKVLPINQTQILLDLTTTTLSNGMYFINLETKQNIYSGKFIIAQ